MLHALIALPLLLSAADTTRIRSATTISVGTGSYPTVYLNLEIGPLPGGKAPVIDRKKFSGTTATIAWHLVDSDTAGAAKIADVLVKCESWTCIVPDTVKDSTTDARILVTGRVSNPGLTVCPMIKCAVLDSATAFQNAVARVRSSGTVVIAGQSPILTLVAISPWKRTIGTENYPDVAVPMAGNVGNWISIKTVPYAVDSVVRWTLSSSGPGCPSCRWDVPYGPVDYQYQIASDPWGADTSRSGGSFVVDTVLKTGPRLHLAGVVAKICFGPEVDSQLLQQDQWLLASYGLSTDSVTSAFGWNGFCAQARRGAWAYRAGNVEIVSGVWVPLKQILDAVAGSAGVQEIPAVAARPTLFRSGSQVRLNLPGPALVRVVDLRGAELMPTCVFAAGTSDLPVQSRNGISFVQVRSGLTTVTLPLDPIR